MVPRNQKRQPRRTAMSISVGDRLPEATFRLLGSEGIEKLTTDEVFAGKTVALFAVPGAFTPTCFRRVTCPAMSTKPAPTQVQGRGHHRLPVGQRSLRHGCLGQGHGRCRRQFPDAGRRFGRLHPRGGSGRLTRCGFGMGERSQRYFMLVKDGVVTVLNVEDSPGVADVSTAEKLLRQGLASPALSPSA